ncbi:MAG: transposase [Chloroflexi bacterium]|nr:transposase [Chloroflexota bacterium]
MSTPEHRRRSIRLPGYDYASPGGYFVTLCTFQRLPLFGDIVNGEMHLNNCGRIAQDCWNAIPGHFPNARLDAFIVMPNHVHGVLWLTPVGAQHAAPLRSAVPRHTATPNNVLPGSLGAIVRSYKSAVSRNASTIHQTTPRFLWQRNYYERIIRDDAELNAVRQYIIDNPTNWQDDEHNPAATHP